MSTRATKKSLHLPYLGKDGFVQVWLCQQRTNLCSSQIASMVSVVSVKLHDVFLLVLVLHGPTLADGCQRDTETDALLIHYWARPRCIERFGCRTGEWLRCKARRQLEEGWGVRVCVCVCEREGERENKQGWYTRVCNHIRNLLLTSHVQSSDTPDLTSMQHMHVHVHV